jgi:hypothetical protein
VFDLERVRIVQTPLTYPSKELLQEHQNLIGALQTVFEKLAELNSKTQTGIEVVPAV